MNGVIFKCGEDADGVDTLVVEETFVLRVDERTEELRVNFLIFHWSAVLVEELAEQYAIGTVYLRSLVADRILYL